MDILDRIKIVMKMNQMNAASFADNIGVQRSNVSHVLTGRNKPSLDFIEKVLFTFPKVNASWLISGHIQSPDSVTPVEQSEPEEITDVKQEIPNVVTNVTEQSARHTGQKRVVKIITFYEDFTFDEYRPNQQ